MEKPILRHLVVCKEIQYEKDENIMNYLDVVDGLLFPYTEKPEALVRLAVSILIHVPANPETYEMEFKVTSPSGKDLINERITLGKIGKTLSNFLPISAVFIARESGIYWFKVYLEEEVFAQTLVEIVFRRSGADVAGLN